MGPGYNEALLITIFKTSGSGFSLSSIQTNIRMINIANWVSISCQFLPPGGGMDPRHVLNFYLTKNQKLANKSTTRGKSEHRFIILTILEFLMHVWLNFNNQILLNEIIH